MLARGAEAFGLTTNITETLEQRMTRKFDLTAAREWANSKDGANVASESTTARHSEEWSNHKTKKVAGGNENATEKPLKTDGE